MLGGKMMKAFKSFITVLGVIVTLGLFTVASASTLLIVKLNNKTGQTLMLLNSSAGDGIEGTNWKWNRPAPKTLGPGQIIDVVVWHDTNPGALTVQYLRVDLQYALPTDSSNNNCYIRLVRAQYAGGRWWSDPGTDFRNCKGKLWVKWEREHSGENATLTFRLQ